MTQATLIHPDEARSAMLQTDHRMGTETIPTEGAAGRVLRAPVYAHSDAPAFDKSAMDGWAVRATATSWTYKLRGSVVAGDEAGEELADGECVRIMTGAPVPKGANQVIRVENGRQEDGIVTVQKAEPSDNIIRRGSLTKHGELLAGGGLLRPIDVGIIASFGVAELEVSRRPVVTVLSTGSELRQLGEPLEGAAIYNSNGPQLLAQLRQAGVDARDGGIVTDEPATLATAVREAVESSDVVVLTGGVSMGDHDYVPSTLDTLGFSALFHRIALKPGKPLLHARREDGRFAFGLPGNPISSFVVCELFVKPFLYHLMGTEVGPATIKARLGREVARSTADRLEYRPVTVAGGVATPTDYRGSAHLTGFSASSGLVRIEIGEHILEEGSEVEVLLF